MINIEEFIKLCQKEFQTFDVVPEGRNIAIIDKKFRVIFDGISYFEIEYLKQ